LTDKPLEDPKDDRLGYAVFARHLAESICKMVPPEGLVIAIYGSWGSGKTTLLNFLAHYLQEKPKDEQPIIVRFNPWWFSGSGDLLYRFFNEFSTAILGKDIKESECSEKLSKISKCLKKLGNILSVSGRLANLFYPIPFPLNSVGNTIAKIGGIIEPESEQKSIYEIKKEIEDELKSMKEEKEKENIRILVALLKIKG